MEHTNQYHSLHLNRPAAVIFRKPLATNAEMTKELEKLLGSFVPMEKKSIRKLASKGLVKAVYISPYLGKERVLGYDQNLVFHTFICPDLSSNEGKQITTNDYINYDVTNAVPRLQAETQEEKKALSKFISTIVSGVASSKVSSVLGNSYAGKFLGKAVGLVTNGITRVSAYFATKLTEESPTYYYRQVTDGSSKDEKLYKRTWYVVTFDKDYYVPDITESGYQFLEFANGSRSVGTTGLVGSVASQTTTPAGLRSPKLDYRVVYSAKKISIQEFDKTIDREKFKRLQSILKNNSIVGIYKIILQGTADYENPTIITKKQALEKLNIFNSKYNGKENLEITCKLDSFYNDLFDKWSRNTKSFASKNTDMQKQFDADEIRRANKRIIDWNRYKSSCVKEDSGLYSIQLKILFPDKPDFMQEILPGTTQKELTGTSYAQIVSNSTSKIFYRVKSGQKYGSMFFTQEASFTDIFTAYYLICKLHNDTVNNVSSNVDVSILAESEEEFPLRYVNQQSTTGLSQGYTGSDYNGVVGDRSRYADQEQVDKTTQDVVSLGNNIAIHNQALYDSFNRGRVGETSRDNVFTTWYRLIDKTKLTVLDFKLMYYYLIRQNVVMPKYNKICSNFSVSNGKYSTVKFFPEDFFTVTLPVSEKEVTIPGMFGPAFTGKELAQIPISKVLNLPVNKKQELVDIFEQVYFGDWSGFYYTNSTTNNESVSKYTNTEVDTSLLTNVVKRYGSSQPITDMLSTADGKSILNLIDLQRYANSSKLLYTTSLDEIINRDVISIDVSRQTMGKSKATIVLKNIDDKYTYTKRGVYRGSSLFEPLDEVMVYLPNLDGDLEMSYKGFISEVQSINQTGYHITSLTCDCPLKLLEIVRTNIKPSYSFLESDYAPIHPFSVPQEMMKSMDNWAPMLMVQGLSYFTSMLGNQKDTLPLYTSTSSKTATEAWVGPLFNDDLLQYMWYRRSNNSLDQAEAKKAFSRLVNKYVYTLTYTNNEPLQDNSSSEGITPLQSILSNNASRNSGVKEKADYIIFAQRSDSNLVSQRRAVGVLTGTLQPAFALGVSEVPLTFSNYKTNLEILLETAEKFNFFFYSGKTGIVNFVPPNISLSSLSLTKDNQVDTDKMLVENDFSYDTSSPDIVNKQTASNYTEVIDDSKLVNWMQLSGGFVQSDSLNAINAGVATVVANSPSITKYGIHAQKQQAILGVDNKEALTAYGMALMDRVNKNFLVANYTSMGSGDMDINRTVYSSISNTVFVRTGLTLTYTSGSTFTSTSTLNWGRKPMCAAITNTAKYDVEVVDEASVTTETVVEEHKDRVDINFLIKQITEIKNENLISYPYFLQVMNILSYIDTTKVLDEYAGVYNHILSSFIFNGYFWDGIPSISFEDLSVSSYSMQVANGFQKPVFAGNTLSNTSTLTSVVSNLIKKLSLPKNTMSMNATGIPLGLFTSATGEDIIKTYLRQSDPVLRSTL